MIQSAILPYCWVCGVRFATSDPPGPAHEERHHIVPRAYGGLDGPQVSLCDKHHTSLHKIAIAFRSKKPYGQWLNQEPESCKLKLTWLATQVFNAEQQFGSDPNKRNMVLVTLDANQAVKLDRLSTSLPKLSRQGVLLLALEQLYARNFVE